MLICAISSNSSRSEVHEFVASGSREDRLGRSNLDLPTLSPKVSAQLPSNKTKSRPLTDAHSHVSLACVASVSVGLSACLKNFSLLERAKIGASAKSTETRKHLLCRLMFLHFLLDFHADKNRADMFFHRLSASYWTNF